MKNTISKSVIFTCVLLVFGILTWALMRPSSDVQPSVLATAVDHGLPNNTFSLAGKSSPTRSEVDSHDGHPTSPEINPSQSAQQPSGADRTAIKRIQQILSNSTIELTEAEKDLLKKYPDGDLSLALAEINEQMQADQNGKRADELEHRQQTIHNLIGKIYEMPQVTEEKIRLREEADAEYDDELAKNHDRLAQLSPEKAATEQSRIKDGVFSKYDLTLTKSDLSHQ